jgi:hypothetical protein
MEVLEPTDTQRRFLDDQQRPALADDLEGRASPPTWFGYCRLVAVVVYATPR